MKLAITSVEASLRSKDICKMISKVTFQMALLLNEASTPSDIIDLSIAICNRRVESNSEFERGQI